MDQLLDTFKNLGPSRLAMMGLTFFGLIIFFIFIMARSSEPSLTSLYTQLSTADATEIAAKLDASNINYSLENNGTEVRVNQKDVARARVLLAQDGLPHKGSIGYEIFDQKQTFGTTSFQQNINQLRAMEGELARTIGTIDNIRSARVHLVLPERELFSRESRPATASVFLNVQNEASITKENIQAIQHLVAAAVPQLKPVNVAIIDQNGNLLAKGEEDPDNATADGADEARQKYEMRLSRSLDEMIGRIVGYGKVRTTVSADLNFDVVSRNSESYNPDQQVVRSTQTVTDQSEDSSGGQDNSVTVQNNLPGLPGKNAANGPTSRSNRTEEVTNYEISKTVENTVRQSGEVKRLSVAVLVDGRYEPDAKAVKPADAPATWEAPRVYTPRSQQELDQLATLVKSAVGYDESRGDTVQVINMQFAETGDSAPLPDNRIMGFERSDLLGVAETLALSIVAVLVILLVLRPLATHFTAAAAAATEGAANAMNAQNEAALLLAQGPGQPQLAGPAGLPGSTEMSELDAMLDMNAVEGKVKASSVQKITELVTNHPTETISVIRQWMSQEN